MASMDYVGTYADAWFEQDTLFRLLFLLTGMVFLAVMHPMLSTNPSTTPQDVISAYRLVNLYIYLMFLVVLSPDKMLRSYREVKDA